MKKKLLSLVLALGMCSISVSAFAADTEVTAESLLADAQAYCNEVKSMSAGANLNLDAAITVSAPDAPESSMGVSLIGDSTMDLLQEPMEMAMKGNYKVAAMGVTQDMDMEMYYTISDDSKVDTYVQMKTGDETSGWQHATEDLNDLLESMNVSSIDELYSMDFSDLLGIDLVWETTENDDSYVISTTINFVDMMPLIKESANMASEDISDSDFQMIEALLGSFTMNLDYTLDKETRAPLSAHIDFNDSDLTAINAMLSSAMAAQSSDDVDTSATELSLVLNDFSMDMDFAYDTVDEILIPAEALAADVIDMEVDDVLNDVVDSADELTEAE